MKTKFLYLMLVAVVFIRCSSDSDANSLTINEENLLGKWYFKGTKIDNGPLENYNNYCPATKDYQEILSSHDLKYYRHTTDCDGLIQIINNTWTFEGDYLTVIDEDPLVVVPSIYKVLKITEEELILSRDFHPISPSQTEVHKYYYTRN